MINWSLLRRIECLGLLGVSGIADGWGLLRRIDSTSACTGHSYRNFAYRQYRKRNDEERWRVTSLMNRVVSIHSPDWA